MHGQRHGAQLRSGEHHHRIARGIGTGGRDEFGLPGIIEADFCQQRLGDRRGDQRRRLAALDDRSGFDQRGERQFGSGAVRCAGRIMPICSCQHGQCVIEMFKGFGGMEQLNHRHRQPALRRRSAQHIRSTSDEKRGKLELFALRPSRRDQFRSDPRRIAERQGEGGQIVQCLSLCS